MGSSHSSERIYFTTNCTNLHEYVPRKARKEENDNKNNNKQQRTTNEISHQARKKCCLRLSKVVLVVVKKEKIPVAGNHEDFQQFYYVCLFSVCFSRD